MKPVFALCAAILVLSQAQAAPTDSVVWVQQQSGVHVSLWQVKFADTLYGWACGDAGTLLRTSDGGQNWRKPASFTSRTINALWFVDPANGWLATDTGQIYKSSDSGATWSLQFFAPLRATFGDLVFIDDSTGLVSGSDMNGANMYNEGIIYKTTNGGTSWTLSKSYLITVSGIGSLSFPDRQHGWAIGSDYLLKTTDGALTWKTPVSFYAITDSAFIKTAGYVNSILFEDTLNGFGIGRYGHIIRTRNGGTSWTLAEKISPWPEGIAFADAAHGFIVGQNGSVLFSRDSGASWTLGYPRPSFGSNVPWFRNVTFKGMNNGWIVGDSGIIMKGSLYVPATGISRPIGPIGTELKIARKPGAAFSVSYFVREAGPVSVDLYDVEGRMVMHLRAGWTNAGEFYEVFSPDRNVSCGAYYLTMRAKGQFASAKMLVAR